MPKRKLVAPKVLNDSFGNWLVGFADGEGCFTVEPCGRKQTENNVRIWEELARIKLAMELVKCQND